MRKILMRDMQNRLAGGVCAGIARHFDLDVSLVRIAFVLAAWFYGGGLLVYLLMWLCIPKDNGTPRNLKKVYGLR